MQNQPPNNGSMIESAPRNPFAPPAPGQAPQIVRSPVASVHHLPNSTDKRHYGGFIETIILIIVALVAVLFVYLYMQKAIEYENLNSDVEGRIDSYVAMAVADNTTKMEEEFAEREKYPYENFLGPADYGSLGFEYPRTWSVYVAKDAMDGSDYAAYFNPRQVQPVSNTTINALRVTIRNASFDTVVKTYDRLVADGKLQFAVRSLGHGLNANIYTGSLPSGIYGIVAAIKSRDKTILIQTDAELFAAEFYKLLDTVTLIQ